MQPFENLRVWHLAQELSVRIDELTERGTFCRATGLRGQMREAGGAIGAMIAEGCGQRTTGQFAHYLDLARATTDELRSHLDRARRRTIIDEAEFTRLADECRLIARMLSALVNRVRAAATTAPSKPTDDRKPTTDNRQRGSAGP